MRTFILLTLSLISFQLFAGGSSTVGPGNPAAINCVKLGGVLESFSTAAGQDANCVIDEWLLWQKMYERGLLKHHDYDRGGGIGLPNPAAVNCIDVEGQIRIEQTPAGERGLCVVEEWTLFKYIDVTREPEID